MHNEPLTKMKLLHLTLEKGSLKTENERHALGLQYLALEFIPDI